jgi:hypothetical protein
MTRSIETTVTFRRPFTLTALDGVQPAGTYRLVEEEEEIAGLSFVAFRRVATLLHVRPIPRPGRPARSCSFCRMSLPRPWRRTPRDYRAAATRSEDAIEGFMTAVPAS